ncbi:MAG: response regulator [Anaerolineales bacterium]|nr:response regulator [Anaerolineales bacterium]
MKKILIVEDEPDILDVIKLTLDIGNYQLSTAANGDLALEMARQEMPDMILLDIMLPGKIDGLEVCRQLKGDEATKGIYIMIVTAKGMQGDKEVGFAAGCDQYIVKPFKIMRLMREIEKILG